MTNILHHCLQRVLWEKKPCDAPPCISKSNTLLITWYINKFIDNKKCTAILCFLERIQLMWWVKPDVAIYGGGGALLTYINFNLSMDKWLHPLWCVGYYYLPFPNLNGKTVEVWEWISNFFPHFTGQVVTYPYCDWSHSMLSKWGPRTIVTVSFLRFPRHPITSAYFAE